MIREISIIFFLIPFFTGAQSVKITPDPNLKNYSFYTFRVVKGDFTTLEQGTNDEEKFFAIMKESIVNELTQKGYALVEDSSAQVVVSYVGQSIKRLDTQQLGPLGQTPTSDAAQVDASRNWSREYNENSVVIDVVDFASRKTLWRANTTFEGQPLVDVRTVNQVVYKSFKKFPANKKKKKS